MSFLPMDRAAFPKLRTLVLLLLAGVCWSAGQDVDGIYRSQNARLEEAVRRLAEVRDRIAAEKLPLVSELNQVDGEVGTLRSNLRRLQGERDSRELGLDALRNRVRLRRQEYEFITGNLAGEFVNSFESSLSSAELAVEGEKVRDFNLFMENADATEEQKLQELLGLADLSVERIEKLLGGRIYPGEALTLEGEGIEGRFLQVGPLLYFSDDSGSQAGWVEESETLLPRLHPLDSASGEMIAGLVRSGSGTLPVDVSLGDALTVRQTRETILEHLQAGGIWVYPICFFALVSTLVIGFKTIQMFVFVRQVPAMVAGRIVDLLQEGRKDEAMALARKQPAPGRDLLVTGVDHAEEPLELVEESLSETMLGIQPRLERFLNIVSVTAATAPLLGLLGTVTGIIKTFNLMQIHGAGDPKPLISGISEALITTELGLILAIPALLMYALLSRQASGILAHLERVAVEFANCLARSRSGLDVSRGLMDKDSGAK